MVTVIPGDKTWENVGANFGSGLTQGYTNRADEMAIQKALSDLPPDASMKDILTTLTGVKTYSPKPKQEMLKNYMGVAQFEEIKRKAQKQEEIAQEKNKIAASKIQDTDAQAALMQHYIDSGMPLNEALILSNPHVEPSIKQRYAQVHADEVARGIRKPSLNAQKQTIEPIKQQPITPQEVIESDPVEEKTPLEKIEEVREEKAAIEQGTQATKTEEWPELPEPVAATHLEKERWRNNNQTFNNKELKEIRKKTNAHKGSLIRYNRLTDLNDSGKLPTGIGRLVINPSTGEPYAIASLAGLVNKETQDFVKTVNDFLIDAKDYFGGRVSNFEVGSFKSRLPTLINTPEGRRVIIEQMKLMQELQILHDNELGEALKHYGRNASYSDILGVVDDKTEQREGQIIAKLNNLDKASNYLDLMAKNPEKYKDMTLWQDPNNPNKFKAFRPGESQEAKSRGWIKW